MFTFVTNAKGDIEAFTAPLEALVKEIRFTRQPGDQLNRSEVSRAVRWRIRLVWKNGKGAPEGSEGARPCGSGQPQYDLEPYKGTEFNIKGISGYSLRFTIDEKKGVTEVTFIQPNGLFKATKKK